MAIASSPLLASLGACDLNVSATASIDQPCGDDVPCPPGQTCSAPTNGRCELATATSNKDGESAGGDATIATDSAPQPDSSVPETGEAAESGEPDASDARAVVADAGDADVADVSPPDGMVPCNPPASPSTLVLFGGEDLAGFFGDTWIWDGTAWSEVDAGDAAAPSPRASAAMATACGYAVLVGGQGFPAGDAGATKGDSWLWDGSGWMEAPSAPPARFDSAAATLGSTMYLFGGAGPGPNQTTFVLESQGSELLAWTGGSWSTAPQSSSTAPDPRECPVVANVGGGLLVFGGSDDLGNPFPDTWLLTDASWQELDDGGTGSGPVLTAAGAASVGGSVVMFGGLDENFETRGDTWIWNGQIWSLVMAQADAGPAARVNPAMGTLNGQVVMFGGADENSNPLGDTWIWDGGSWGPGPDAGPASRFSAMMTAY